MSGSAASNSGWRNIMNQEAFLSLHCLARRPKTKLERYVPD